MFRVSIILLLLLTVSCKQNERAAHGSKKAFYYWQTNVNAFPWHDSLYRSMKADKLYFRFFDVDWSEDAKAPVPVSPLKLRYSRFDDTTEVVPVVFITNETFKKLDKDQSIALARNVKKKVMTQLNKLLFQDYYWEWWQQDPYNIKSINFDEHKKHDSAYVAKMERFREIQFDCDWTESTKDNYFAFLQEARKLFKDQLVTSTIRLYQYKYPKKAGVPPVARGMLMCYNAGNIKDTKTRNSIFDKGEVMSYLKAEKYPVPLDYALPIFEWAVLYRDGSFRDILSASMLREEYARYLGDRTNDHSTVTEDFVYGNTAQSTLIRQGDEIRFEQPDMEDVEDVAAWLADNKNNPEAILTLYHLNDHDLQKHSKAIESIFSSF